jgi:hypothetical protein
MLHLLMSRRIKSELWLTAMVKLHVSCEIQSRLNRFGALIKELEKN